MSVPFKIAFLTISIFIFGSTLLFAKQDMAKVTIQVISKNLEPYDEVYIVGNKIELGNWHPDIVKLEKGPKFWSKTFEFEIHTTLEFKFTKGTWGTEALNNDGEIPNNNILIVKRDTTLTHTICYWNKSSSFGQVTGNVKYHNQLSYKGLLPRDIIVWLPPGYNNNVNRNYPVLYMHDGQNIFDPSTSFTNIDWQMDESADSLIRKNEIEPLIIVGIYHTNNRTIEYSPGPASSIYKHFVVEKLKPFIDSTYRTIPNRDNTFVGGSSSGGIISFMLLWEYSNIFSKAACFSPAFATDYYNYPLQIKDSEICEDIKVYIDNGGIGVDEILQPGIDLMLETLRDKGYNEGIDFIFNIYPSAEHNEAAWAKRVPTMLKFLFNK